MTVLMTRLMYCLSCFGPLDRFWEDAGIPALDLFCHKHSKIYCSSSNSSAHPGTRHASKNVNDVFSITWSFGEIHFNIEKKKCNFFLNYNWSNGGVWFIRIFPWTKSKEDNLYYTFYAYYTFNSICFFIIDNYYYFLYKVIL